jgi:hypothetical protein
MKVIPHTHVVLVSNLIISKIRINTFHFIDDHHCQQGKCTPLSATLPPKHIPIHIYILIGVGVALIGLISIIIGAIYWQRRQIKQTEKSFEPSATFSQPSNISFRNNSSVGSLRHASTSEPSSVEATVNKETSTTA